MANAAPDSAETSSKTPRKPPQGNSKQGKPRRQRERFTDEQRALVAARYPACRTREEKLQLMREAGISSLRRLYQLAYTLGVTRPSLDLSDQRFAEYVAGDKSSVLEQRRADEKTRKEVRARRDDPRRPFKDTEDQLLQAQFGRLELWRIAAQLERSETALLYRARHLGLRQAAFGFELELAAQWMDLTPEQLRRAVGGKVLQHEPACDNPGVRWVPTVALGEMIRRIGKWLIRERNPDPFFIREIQESAKIIEEARALKSGTDRIAACAWLDHSNQCRNPSAGPCFSLFCDGADRQCRVRMATRPIRHPRPGQEEVDTVTDQMKAQPDPAHLQ